VTTGAASGAPAARGAGRPPLEVRRLGVVPYAEALSMQRALVEERRAGRTPDLLLLLQHPPVITLGVRAGARSNVVATPDRLAALGIDVVESGRGGDVTYHGPGQVVGYPIMDLRPGSCDVHRYVRDLEEVARVLLTSLRPAAASAPGLRPALRCDRTRRQALLR
jgi:lipoyl(octanoyl) transferase